jgi:hypothetical protein
VQLVAGELFTDYLRVGKHSSAGGVAGNSAHATTEDSSKIKDRLEALLSAETLQGTLSPNANPGKGPNRGLSVLDAKSCRVDSAGSPDTVHLSSVDLLYQSA